MIPYDNHFIVQIETNLLDVFYMKYANLLIPISNCVYPHFHTCHLAIS